MVHIPGTKCAHVSLLFVLMCTKSIRTVTRMWNVDRTLFFFFSVSKIIAETLDSETLEFLGSEDKINNQDCMLAVYYADTSHSFCLHFSSSVTEVLYVDIVACEKETFVGVV